jgi:hypothetical protein
MVLLIKIESKQFLNMFKTSFNLLWQKNKEAGDKSPNSLNEGKKILLALYNNLA